MENKILRSYSFKKFISTILLIAFSISIFTVNVKAGTGGMIENNSFKSWLDGWTVGGDTSAAAGKGNWGQDDSFSLGFWKDKDYEVWAEQTITGLQDGNYKVEAYAANSGGGDSIYIYAKDFGGTGAKTSIPVSSNKFSKVVLNFKVTNGKATIGFYSKAKANNWANFDNVTITKVAEEYKFLKGGDLTMANIMEDMGAIFYDENGEARDVFHVLAENGFNLVRLRTHNDTGRETGIENWYLPEGYQNTEDLLKLAKRAKDVGMEIEVTLNYSDWWPNAATQEIPSSWAKEIEGLSDEATVDKLEELIYQYTKDIMQKLADQGTTPEYISLGNEMHTGILFPYGKVSNTENFKRFINAGYKAVKDVSTNTQVILHLDDAGNTSKYTAFFDQCENTGVKYDVIGASYYPFWTKKNVDDIIPWFNTIGAKYQKKIMIMETGYNWNPTLPSGEAGQLKDNGNETFPSSPQGQKEFLDKLFNGIKNVENNWVIGDMYWDPIMIDQEGIGWAIERGAATDGSEDRSGVNVVSNTTIFDFDGKALPALKAFRDNSDGTTKGMLSGIVRGEGGNTIANVTVNLNIGGKECTKTTDKYGRFFLIDLDPASGTVQVNKSGYSEGNGAFNISAAETTNVEIIIKGGNVKGVIKDKEGNPLKGVKVYSKVDGIEFQTNSLNDGSYTLSDLPEGSNYDVFAEIIGYGTEKVSGVKVKVGENTDGVNFELKINSGTIAGSVVNDLGNKVEGVKVVISSKEGKEYSTITDDGGKYTVDYVLSDGNYNVTASKRGYLEGKVTGIVVKNGEVTSDVNLTIKANFGSITGVVVDSNNNKVKDATITVNKDGNKLFTVTSEENGVFTIENILDEKDYEVTIIKESLATENLTNVVVNPGQVTELVIRLATPITINNGNFDNGNLDGWEVEATKDSVVAQDRTRFGSDAPSGKYALSLWLGDGYTANIYQNLTGLKSGKYLLRAMVYTGGFKNEARMYVNNESIDLQKNEGWTEVSLPVWINEDNATIGFSFDAGAGDWAVIDNVEFNFITSINYDTLEANITTGNSIKKDIYTPSSIKVLEAVLLEAKALLVSNDVTQELVDKMATKVSKAIENLMQKSNKTKLLEKIAEAEKVDLTKYTEESGKILLAAIEKARIVAGDDNASEEVVLSEIESLSTAINTLVLKKNNNEENSNSNNSNSNSTENNGNTNGSGDCTQDDSVIVDGNNNNNSDTSVKLPSTGARYSSILVVILGIASVVAGISTRKNIRKKIS